MANEKIQAETRTEFGKGAARRIRRENKVPVVIYGHGADPVHLTMPGHTTMMALKRGGANALLEIEAGGVTHLALTKQIQVDPLKRTLEHIDFVAVRRGEKVTVDIPVTVLGEAGPDTLVVLENATVQVEAEATHIPEGVEVSVEGKPAGTQILASELDLPADVELLVDGDTLVVNITEQVTAEALEAELEEAEAEAGIERDVSDEEIADAAGEAVAEDAAREAGDTPAGDE